LIIGNRHQFGIESDITEAHDNPGLFATGYFLVFLNGRQFGVRHPDATMLACSIDEAKSRLVRKGKHIAPCLEKMSAREIALCHRQNTYSIADSPLCRSDLIDCGIVGSAVERANLIWIPDGDAAFDDGSHILQIDCGFQVRLIGFRNLANAHDTTSSLCETIVPAETFYRILHDWVNGMEELRAKLLIGKVAR
jgi:hypothetical protein